MDNLELDINTPNANELIESGSLRPRRKKQQYSELYRYASVNGIDSGEVDKAIVEEAEKGGGKDTLKNVLDTLKGFGEGLKKNLTTGEGYTIEEIEKGKDKTNKGTQVRILGMKPLIFVLVSLGVVIASGVAIARINK